MVTKQKAEKIIRLLRKKYPKVTYPLKFSNPLELLVGAILSAQCTDERVLQVTEKLFKKYKKPRDYAKVGIKQLEVDIKSTGFYKNKAKNIKEASKIIDEKFKGKVPSNMKDLISLPGVARKTANVILQDYFNKVEGIIVDTHVIRLSQRLALTKNKESKKIEKDLMNLLSKKYWKSLSWILKAHGRKICKAPIPSCSKCFLNNLCPKEGVKKEK